MIWYLDLLLCRHNASDVNYLALIICNMAPNDKQQSNPHTMCSRKKVHVKCKGKLNFTVLTYLISAWVCTDKIIEFVNVLQLTWFWTRHKFSHCFTTSWLNQHLVHVVHGHTDITDIHGWPGSTHTHTHTHTHPGPATVSQQVPSALWAPHQANHQSPFLGQTKVYAKESTSS